MYPFTPFHASKKYMAPAVLLGFLSKAFSSML